MVLANQLLQEAYFKLTGVSLYGLTQDEKRRLQEEVIYPLLKLSGDIKLRLAEEKQAAANRRV